METVWYLCAVNNNPEANEYIVKVIGEQNSEYLCKDRLCTDGKERNLFKCPLGYVNVRSAIAAVSKFNLKIDVFKESTERAISKYDLWKPSVRKAAYRSIIHRKFQLQVQ